MSSLVMIPISREQASDLVTKAELTGPIQAFVPNAQLREAFGYSESDDEEAERATLLVASVWGLARYGERRVLVVDAADSRFTPGLEENNGGVWLDRVEVGEVSSWFTDDRDADDRLAVAASDASGLTLDEAWELDSVTDLITDHDLLWHAGDELACAMGE